MNNELNMRVHIDKVAAICFFHPCRLRQLRFVLTSSSMQRFISALIISRIDYCNSVLYGLPAITLAPLQTVLHVAVRLVANLGYHDHMTSAMKELHWLPIAYHIKYKLAHDARGSKQQKLCIYYRYTCPDIISASPWAASFARVQMFRSTLCADRVWKKSFFHRRPYGLEHASKHYTKDWQIDNTTTFKRVLKAYLFKLTSDC